METSQSLSIESFSYSWLVDLGDSFRASMDDSGDDYETAFIEMDPALPPSKRFFNVNPQDLNFDFPTSDSSLTLVHADELISNGFLVPLFIKKPMKMESDYDVIESHSIANSPASSAAQQQDESCSSSCRRVNRCVSLRRCRSLSRRILLKYFDFLRPFCQKIRRCSRIDLVILKALFMKLFYIAKETINSMLLLLFTFSLFYFFSNGQIQDLELQSLK
ncbi:hypothetical protein MTR67_014025 [Solanum verrucosum]|uniref:Membrane-associated kinase regulator 6 n=1 Tax=Solanum verrucosum TaxID=315347 RepID=A0AAF0QG35_SOLVR|nr:hypothetical protein MTR67_014025 [Solanum verrucosum]